MSDLPIFLSALTGGLVGGFAHCIGMCGVFVLSYAGLPDKGEPRRALHAGRHILFHTGRLFSLGLLGAIAGIVGGISHHWATVQSALSLVAGVTMFALALGVAGVLPRLRIPEPDVMGAGGGRVRRAFLRALRSRHALRPLLIGLFVGLLPCGLTYTVLIGALALRPLSGALLMLAFGLGTVPGLLTLGVFGNTLFGGLLTRPLFRSRMTQVSAAFMAVLGVAFVWRGVANL